MRSEGKDIPQCEASLELDEVCLMRCNLAIWKLEVVKQRYIPRVATLTATHGREFIRMRRLLSRTGPDGFQGGGDAKVGPWIEIQHPWKE